MSQPSNFSMGYFWIISTIDHWSASVPRPLRLYHRALTGWFKRVKENEHYFNRKVDGRKFSLFHHPFLLVIHWNSSKSCFSRSELPGINLNGSKIKSVGPAKVDGLVIKKSTRSSCERTLYIKQGGQTVHMDKTGRFSQMKMIGPSKNLVQVNNSKPFSMRILIITSICFNVALFYHTKASRLFIKTRRTKTV